MSPANWLILLSGFLVGGAGAALLVEAVVQRLGRARRRPRCCKCMYDMAPVAAGPFPVTCPECGRAFRTRRQLFGVTRRRVKAVAGVVLIAGGLGLAMWSHGRQWGLLNTMPTALHVWVWPLDHPRIHERYTPQAPLGAFERVGLRLTTDMVLANRASDIRTQQALVWLASAKLSTRAGDEAANRLLGATPGGGGAVGGAAVSRELQGASLAYRLATGGITAEESLVRAVVAAQGAGDPAATDIVQMFGVTGRTPEQMRRTRELIEAITPNKISRAVWSTELTTAFADSAAEVLADALDRGDDQKISQFVGEIVRNLRGVPNGEWLATFRRGVHSDNQQLRRACIDVFEDYERKGQSEAIAAGLDVTRPSAPEVIRLMGFRATYCKDPIPEKAIEAIFAAIGSADERLAREARVAMDDVPESAHPRVIALLDHPSALVRERACEVVGRLTPVATQAAPRLRELGADLNQPEDVRLEARGALKAMRTRTGRKDL